jgi:predicted kinase
MQPTTVVLVTGHPASGKTTLVRYLAKELSLPTFCKDDIKEILYDTLGWSTEEWSYRLSAAAWTLLYYQVEILLEAHTNHITESNFVPAYADPQWQALKQRFDFHLIQVRCECDPDVLLQRYRNRILTGERHPGHRDGGDESAFHKLMHAGPMGWIDVESERISVDTTHLAGAEYETVARRIREAHLRFGAR